MSYKLLITDMDGTFLDGQGQFNQARLGVVIAGLKEQGIRFGVASGRCLRNLTKIFAPFAQEMVFIAENGTMVQVDQLPIFEANIPRPVYLRTLETIQEMAVFGFDHLEELVLSGVKGAYVHKSASQAFIEASAHYYGPITAVDDYAEIEDDILKIDCHFDPDQMVAAQAWLANNLTELTPVTTGFDSIDIILNQVDKGVALDALCQHLEISHHEVMAFGDNYNDLQLLEKAGYVVVPSNAVDAIKALADEEIGHHADSSVIRYMEKFIEEHN